MEWSTLLAQEKQQKYFVDILAKVKAEIAQGKNVYPRPNEYFNAFKYTSFEQLKVVIIGQDPYHGPGQAHGLSFSVPEGITPPPSLKNIFKELQQEQLINKIPDTGCLIPWAKQGVLLLNTVLTVEANAAQSHGHIGWQAFTDIVIQEISAHKEHLVFLLWGKHAQQKQKFIDKRHTILTTSHPSPLSAHRGFLGCGHFAKANAALAKNQQTIINWQL